MSCAAYEMSREKNSATEFYELALQMKRLNDKLTLPTLVCENGLSLYTDNKLIALKAGEQIEVQKQTSVDALRYRAKLGWLQFLPGRIKESY